MRRPVVVPLLAGALVVVLVATVLTTARAHDVGGGRDAAPAPGGRTTSIVGPVPTRALHVMSFNVRYAGAPDDHPWRERLPVVRELLAVERPHVLAVQEAEYAQVRDLAAALGPAYEQISLGRSGGSRGEAMAVYVDTRRLRPLAYDHRWLSATPETIGSSTWGGCCPRMLTWVRLRDRVTGEVLTVLNTHLQSGPAGAEARTRSVDVLLDTLDTFPAGRAVVVTGDFNTAAAPGREVYRRLLAEGGLVDTWSVGTRRTRSWGTAPGYRPPVAGGPRIDWILASAGTGVRSVAIDPHRSDDGTEPSDHLPVHAVLRP